MTPSLIEDIMHFATLRIEKYGLHQHYAETMVLILVKSKKGPTIFLQKRWFRFW